MSETILILGGTKEAAALAEKLVAEGNFVITSLAGRTKEPRPLAGEVRIGGFGGTEGLSRFITQNAITLLIDATHPFARQISENARKAARETGIRFDQRTRPPWKRKAGDNWIEVASLEAARDAIPPDARVLLALGSQHIGAFSTRKDVHFLVRMVDPPERDLPLEQHSLVLGRPPTDTAAEIILLKTHSITHIVCRNSGGAGAYAKIEAARQLGLPVIMIERPDA